MPGFFRTGQAARALGVTPHWIRRAARTGILESEETPSGQLRVPCEEIARLQKQKETGGLPALPADEVEPDSAPEPNPGRPRSPLLGPASQDLVADTETVVSAANNLKRWKTKKEIVQVQDWFLERDAQAQDADLERERIHAQAGIEREDRAAARQVEQERREAAQQRESDRREIFNSWYSRALGLIPYDVPAPTKAACLRAIEGVLQESDLEFGHSIMPALEAEIEIALADWRREKETEAAIESGVASLPAAARVWGADYQDRARLAAAAALEELRDGASLSEKEAAARRAGASIAQEFAAEQKRISEQTVRDELVIVQWWALGLTGFTESDYESAQQEIRAALEELPLGTPLDRLRKAREQVLQRIKSRAKAQTTRKELDQTVSRRLEASLPHADRYIAEHYQSFDQDFGNLRATQHELRKIIRPELSAELQMRGGDLSDQAIQQIIESLIDEELYD